MREPFDQELPDESGVPRGAAGDDLNALGLLQPLLDRRLFQRNPAAVAAAVAAQRLPNGKRLLENLFQHEVPVGTFLHHRRIPVDARRRLREDTAVAIEKDQAIAADDGNLAVFQKDDISCVRQDRRDVGCDEKLPVANAHHDRRAFPYRDNLARIVGRHEDHAVNALDRTEALCARRARGHRRWSRARPGAP